MSALGAASAPPLVPAVPFALLRHPLCLLAAIHGQRAAHIDGLLEAAGLGAADVARMGLINSRDMGTSRITVEAATQADNPCSNGSRSLPSVETSHGLPVSRKSSAGLAGRKDVFTAAIDTAAAQGRLKDWPSRTA